jgi:hypothetical protein
MYLGDFLEDSTVNFMFTTNGADGAAIAPLTAYENSDIIIFKNNSATHKTAVDGITMTSPFHSIVGLHQVSIDTSNDTNDAGFWVTGNDYTVVLSADTETVDGKVVVAVIAVFSIQNRNNKVNVADIVTAMQDTGTMLKFVRDIFEGDCKIDITTVSPAPYDLVVYIKDTATELVRKKLYTTAGVAIRDLTTIIGQQMES